MVRKGGVSQKSMLGPQGGVGSKKYKNGPHGLSIRPSGSYTNHVDHFLDFSWTVLVNRLY